MALSGWYCPIRWLCTRLLGNGIKVSYKFYLVAAPSCMLSGEGDAFEPNGLERIPATWSLDLQVLGHTTLWTLKLSRPLPTPSLSWLTFWLISHKGIMERAFFFFFRAHSLPSLPPFSFPVQPRQRWLEVSTVYTLCPLCWYQPGLKISAWFKKNISWLSGWVVVLVRVGNIVIKRSSGASSSGTCCTFLPLRALNQP